jgi:hypothetical protein
MFRQRQRIERRPVSPHGYPRSGSGDLLLKSKASLRGLVGRSQPITRRGSGLGQFSPQPFLRISRHESGSLERRKGPRLLQPLLLAELGRGVGREEGEREREVEEQFYREVRVLQGFKQLGRLCS